MISALRYTARPAARSFTLARPFPTSPRFFAMSASQQHQNPWTEQPKSLDDLKTYLVVVPDVPESKRFVQGTLVSLFDAKVSLNCLGRLWRAIDLLQEGLTYSLAPQDGGPLSTPRGSQARFRKRLVQCAPFPPFCVSPILTHSYSTVEAGATFADDSRTTMTGSYLLMRGESPEQIKARLSKDIYSEGGAWDVPNVRSLSFLSLTDED